MYQDRDIEELIVQQLKKHLDIQLTLAGFSDISGQSLIELLNTIVNKIDSTQPEKIGPELIEDTVNRISEFLRVLKYPFPVAPQEWDKGFAEASKDLLYPAIFFLLDKFEDLKKKIYYARYAEDIVVPEEIRVDDSVSTLLSQYSELREIFKSQYNENVELGETNVDILKAKIHEIEQDLGRINQKVNQFKRQLKNQPNLDSFLSIISKTRIESEKELKFTFEKKKLIDEKKLMEHRQIVCSERIKNFLKNLQEKRDKLKIQIDSYKNNPSPDGKQTQMFQQQVISIQKKLVQKKSLFEETIKQRENDEQAFRERQSQGIIEVPNPQQFELYFQRLQTQNHNYKELNSELNSFKKMLAELLHTKVILEKQLTDLEEEIRKIAVSKNVSDFIDLKQQIDEYAVDKNDLDQSKGQTLEELSKIDSEIQKKIKARQDELKPQVAQIQEQRKQKAQLETQFLQAKNRYQTAIQEYETSCLELDEELKKYRQELANYQTKFFTTQGHLNCQARDSKRAKEEDSANQQGNSISKTIKTYTDFFHKEARKLGKTNKDLKVQKSEVGKQSNSHQKQLEMFQSLRRLLQVKEESQKQMLEKRKNDAIQDQIEINGQEFLKIED